VGGKASALWPVADPQTVFTDRDRAVSVLRPRSGPPVTLTWSGAASFLVEAEGTRVALDPFVTRPGVRETLLEPARSDRELVDRWFPDIDAVFVGHSRYDHLMDVPTVARPGRSTVVHGSTTTVELAEQAGVPSQRLRVAMDGVPVTIGPVRVTPVSIQHGMRRLISILTPTGAPESGLPRTAGQWPCGDVFAYRVEVGDLSMHVQGSAGLDGAALARQAPADVLVVCLALRQGTRDLVGRLGAQLRPRVLMPCHHDVLSRPVYAEPRPLPLLRWSGFLADAKRLHESYGTLLQRCTIGQSLVL
jgi:L-ascorbate metabolism protein UlaG (beta-lactamase superfamily)